MIRYLLAAAAAALALTGCDSAPEQQAQRASETPPSLTGEIVRSQAGTALPEMTLRDPSGARLDTASLKGKPVLLNLWATWCAPCVTEMPMLDRLADEFGEELKVLTVSQDIRGAEVVVPFFAERDFANLEPWLDEEMRLSDALGGEGLMPLTVLFDAQGREIFRVSGGYEWDSEEAIAQIREAIAE